VPYWNRGYCTEASRAVIELGFTQLGLHRIQARHLTRNPASGRVMQKLGMQPEGVNRDAILKNDRFEDLATYAILADEWMRRRGA
jgi:RimJ/RimL family protein N-acetyltransferase